MTDQWYYTQQGQRCGPVPSNQLKELATSGQLRPADLVWQKGMAQWVKAGELPDFFGPTSTAEENPLNIESWATSSKSNPPPLSRRQTATNYTPAGHRIGSSSEVPQVGIGYQIALAVAGIASFLPWVTCSGSGSVSIPNIPGFSPGYSNSIAASASLSGVDVGWGWLALLAAVGGIAVTFTHPSRYLAEKTNLVMAAIGSVIVLSAIIGIATANSHFGGNAQINTAFGSSSRSISVAFGLYIALLAGIASVLLGLIAHAASGRKCRKDYAGAGR